MTAVPLLADHFRLLLGDAARERGRRLRRCRPREAGQEVLRDAGRRLALITKERPEQQVAEVTNVIGRVRGKSASSSTT